MDMATFPFKVNESMASTGTSGIDLDHLLGQRFMDTDGKVFMLVKTGASCAAVRKRVFKWTSRSAYTVELATALTDQIAGVGVSDHQDTGTLASGYYLLLQRGGRATVTHGNEATNVAASGKPYLIASDDADTGKLEGVATATLTTEAPDVVFGIYVSGTGGDDADIVCDLILARV